MKKFKTFDLFNLIVLTLFSLFCVLPMILVVIVSLTNERAIKLQGYSFFPKEWSIQAYKVMIKDPLILNSYGVSILMTLLGTLIAVTITSMAAYTLANKQVKYRNGLALFFFFTMIFNAGLVPWYIMCTKLGLKDNIMSLIIPGILFSPFNMFLVRNFMSGIPDSLMESAKIDGATDAYIAFKIYFPLCTPVIATIALFYGLDYWNSWFNAIMLVDNQKLYPLQYVLFKLQSEIAMMSQLQTGAGVTSEPPGESLKMATAIVTIGPIIFLYPFLQRYFVKGLIIGSVKG